MEAALVSAAAGALKPVLGKLAALLGDEYKRFRRVRKEIGFLTRELAAMEAFLLKKSMEEEDPDIQDKVWMNEVRELSYDIEDSLDDFMVHARDKSAKPGFMKKIKNLLDKTKDRRQIAKAIEELKKQVIEASERHKRYVTGESISKVNNLTIDPRALAIFEDVTNLVGIDGPKNELIRLFTQEIICESRQQQTKLISIVGFGGLGKTTLASQVYKELREQYDCHAFVSVSRNPDIVKVLGMILSQVSCRDYSITEDIPHLITRISNFLANKRYIIVVDDIWNVKIWDVIKFAFPLNGYDCRIITTTRVNNVAQSCRSSFNGHIYNMGYLSMVHSKQLFYKRLFNSENCPSNLEEVSGSILEKCAGLPLAIIAISGLLANKEKTMDQWRQVEYSIGRGMERNSSIEGMMKIITLSYFDLPHDLKTCLLYLSIYPEDYIIGKEMLIRRWIAEGFIQRKHGYTLYEAGEMCFNELINRSLIQPDFTEQYYDEVSGCRVHDTILDFIVSKSIEDNFVTIIGLSGVNPRPQDKVRRLSLQNNGEIPVGLISSAVRSLNIFGRDVKIPSLSEFKHMRVLCFEDYIPIVDHHLVGIGHLLHLKLLRLNKVEITKVPEEIKKLRYLETLDIICVRANDPSVPATISLDGRLVHFNATGCIIPNEIEGMEALQVANIHVTNQSTNFYLRLGDLTNLRKLSLYAYEAERGMACSIRKLVKANLRSLDILLDGEPDNLVEELNLPGECSLQELSLGGGRISKVPRWMGSLVNLQKLSIDISSISKEDVEILGGLPDLRYIRVSSDGRPADHIKAAMGIMIAVHPNHPILEWSVWDERCWTSVIFEKNVMF
uniref:Uncharacterized protein n=1 Tax=Avena sativa TaxID=4498 RepID=A0ACD6A7Z8_AVESA